MDARRRFAWTGIGIFVELARQLGVGFVREDYKATILDKHEEMRARRHKDDPPEAQSPG